MENGRWEHFPHQADIGVRGCGPSIEAAFVQAAIALTAVITDPANVTADTAVQIDCSADDNELLLADWLNRLLYEMAIHQMLFSRFEVSIKGTALTATAWGETIDVARHRPTVEIKAATYNQLSVISDNNGNWTAQCVVDV